MPPPERYRRHPTRAAIDALATRFALRNEPGMQDWEYEVADPTLLPAFLDALERDEFTDDERFTLSRTVMQCFEDLAASGRELADMNEWKTFVSQLRARPRLHASTIWYWSAFDSTLEDAWHVSGLVRQLWAEVEPATASLTSRA